MLRPINLRGFVLQEEDIKEFLPDATQKEMEDTASVLTELLMMQWSSCLEEAVQIIKNDRLDKNG